MSLKDRPDIAVRPSGDGVLFNDFGEHRRMSIEDAEWLAEQFHSAAMEAKESDEQ